MSFTLFTSDHFTPQLICGVSGFAGCGGLPGEIPGIIPGGAGFPGKPSRNGALIVHRSAAKNS